MDFFYKYFVAILVALILFLLYRLIRYGIKQYFAIQMKKAQSTGNVALSGMGLLSIAFLSLTALGNTLISLLVQALNQKYPSAKFKEPDSFISLFAFIVFAIAIVYICVLYYKQYSNQIEKRENQERERIINLTIEVPPVIPQESPIFHERVKDLFQLKYKKFQLDLDSTKNDSRNRILYGSYSDRFKVYYKLIFCWDNYEKIISIQEQEKIYEMLSEYGQKLSENKPESVIDYYCIVNGKYEKPIQIQYPMNLFTENEFVENLIDFEPYLKQLCKKFEEDKLPFSSIDRDENKFTLAETYILPHFNEGQDNLSDFLDKWLEEDSLRHISLLGDYGTGKTSFMKYYAYQLSKNILVGCPVKRFPIFISLTSTSPMHGGVEQYIQAFLGKNDLEANYETLQKLVHKGKIVFLLDGFDEMGFIGTHENRFEQLNAIWRLATKNNKIIISGRPSYFPSEFEEKSYLNIKTEEERNVPQALPFCERLQLDFFKDEQIKDSIKTYYPNYEIFWDFIVNNNSIYELCKRPSMMHIVREMLPQLTQENPQKELKSGELMKLYIDHWLDRQNLKAIVTAFKNKEAKKDFIFNFFTDLAGDNYDESEGNIALKASDIRLKLKESFININIEGEDQIQGFESEILTGYFIERQNDYFKFVHKSFFEYFVSQKIIALVKSNNFKHNLIYTKNWSEEIESFFYESFSKEIIEKSEKNKIPLLLYLSQGKIKGKIISISIQILFSISNVLFKVINAIYIKSNVLIVNLIRNFNNKNKLVKSSIIIFGMIIFCLSLFMSIKYDNAEYVKDLNFYLQELNFTFILFFRFTSIFLFMSILGICLNLVLSIGRSKNRLLLYAFHCLVIGFLPLNITKLVYLDKTFSHSMFSLFYISSFAVIIFVIIIRTPMLYFIGKTYKISFNKNYFQKNTNPEAFLFTIFSRNQITNFQHDILKFSYKPITFSNAKLVNAKIESFLTIIVNSSIDNVSFIGKSIELVITASTVKNTNFDLFKTYNSTSFYLTLRQLKENRIDKYSMISLINFIKRENLEIGKQIEIIDCDWILEEFKDNQIPIYNI